MKVTLETVYGYASNTVVAEFDVYFNGALKGWMGLFSKLTIDDAPEGENTIEIICNRKWKKTIRFYATKDVAIWIRGISTFALTQDRFDTLIQGKDLKVIEQEEGRNKIGLM